MTEQLMPFLILTIVLLSPRPLIAESRWDSAELAKATALAGAADQGNKSNDFQRQLAQENKKPPSSGSNKKREELKRKALLSSAQKNALLMAALAAGIAGAAVGAALAAGSGSGGSGVASALAAQAQQAEQARAQDAADNQQREQDLNARLQGQLVTQSAMKAEADRVRAIAILLAAKASR